MSDDWDDIAEWWIATTGDGPADSDEMLDIARMLIDPAGGRALDLGCGEGQALALLGDGAIGVDLSHRLLLEARTRAPVVRCRLPELSWIRSASIDQALAVGVLELIDDEVEFFAQAAAAVRSGGALVVVMNHPVVTAADSEPLVDESGEVLWRWGRYLDRGSLTQAAGHRTVRLHHRPLGELLTAAASSGWNLEHLVEAGANDHTMDTTTDHRGHEHLPSVLGVRWRRT